jgi:hypothetical protein
MPQIVQTFYACAKRSSDGPASTTAAPTCLLTFDMSGGPKAAKRPLERPLDGGVRFHAHNLGQRLCPTEPLVRTVQVLSALDASHLPEASPARLPALDASYTAAAQDQENGDRDHANEGESYEAGRAPDTYAANEDGTGGNQPKAQETQRQADWNRP